MFKQLISRDLKVTFAQSFFGPLYFIFFPFIQAIIFNFLQQLCAIHQHANYNNKTAYTGDMGAFNYLARTVFNQQLIHGAPVNTVFKGYEIDRNDCWFRHK